MKFYRLVIASALLSLPAISAKAQDEYGRRQVDTAVRLDRGGVVDLSLISGKIRVTGWDRQDVKVSASIESGLLRFDANSSRVTLSVEGSDDGPKTRHHNVGDARYDVSVPRGSRLVLEAVSGDVWSGGSQGEVGATRGRGGVRIPGAVGVGGGGAGPG